MHVNDCHTFVRVKSVEENETHVKGDGVLAAGDRPKLEKTQLSCAPNTTLRVFIRNQDRIKYLGWEKRLQVIHSSLMPVSSISSLARSMITSRFLFVSSRSLPSGATSLH